MAPKIDKHFKISMVKSVLRIFAAMALIVAAHTLSIHGMLPKMLMCSGIGFVLAEILGIAEEF